MSPVETHVAEKEDSSQLIQEEHPAMDDSRRPSAVIRMDSMEIDLFQNASAPFLADLLKAVRHA